VKAWAANTLWVASCLPEWRHFQRAAQSVRETQATLLNDILRANAHTEYGQRYHFSDIRSPEEYQHHVPLTNYDDYATEIERIGAGQPNILTTAPVRMFELSSGSTAASKLIPYTDKLKAEFQRGLAPWIYDLYSHLPDLKNGPAYWSVTPLTEGKRFTPGGIPIGFDSDSAYLGPLGRWLVENVLAVPDTVKLSHDVDTFRYQTLLHLLRCRNLRLISVWNPTFLKLLLDFLPTHWDALLSDFQSLGDFRNLRRLRAASPLEPESLWPHLRLISCWTDGPSTPYASQLRTLFPNATMQGKGLLATEAFVSFPLVGVEGAALAVRSHFFEFLDEAGNSHLAHQLETGQSYRVVVTTSGGLYRYQLHDIVEVIGHWQQVPCIHFMGKAEHISDWFGEKLNERFVATALERLEKTFGLSPTFTLLAPESNGAFRYVLYLESDRLPTELSAALDAALRENFHYDYCRKLGQIAAAQVVPVHNGAQTYLAACQARGQKLGNIKPGILQKNTGWEEAFKKNA
jgi:hypothetical protein